ncbi:MAG: OmpP1/FadL family transporter [Ignavibacteriaceae bacterium]
MIKNLKKIFILLILLSVYSFPQSSSSYTRIGIGDLVYSYSARSLGMGQLGTSVAVPDFTGIINPAGWFRIDRTRFEIGIDDNNLFLNDKTQSGRFSNAVFNGFTLSFPVSDKYGVGFAMGIVPYSKVGYNVSQKYSSPITNVSDYHVSYVGSGGLSRTFIGSSFEFPFGLVLGASLDYYFGEIDYSSQANFTSTSNVSTNYLKSYKPNGLGTTLGLISPDISLLFKSNSISDLRVGVAFNYISKLNVDTIGTSSSILGLDTLGFGSTTMKIPLRISAGLSMALSKKYLVSIDFLTQPWQNFSNNGVVSLYLRNAYKVSAGFEYRPLSNFGSTFWQNVIWRAGLGYEQTQYSINGTGINQYSISGGFSLPLSYQNTLDVGVQYSSRGTTDFNLIKENSIRVDIGLSLGELWFVQTER